MNMMIRVCLSLGVFSLLACTDSGRLSESDRSKIKHEIRQMLDSASNSVQRQGLVGFIPFLDPSPEFRWTYRQRTVNYDTLVAGTGSRSRQYLSASIQWDTVSVDPITLDRATVVAKYVESLTDTAGTESTLTGTITGDVIRTHQGWKFQIARTDSGR